MIRLKILSEIMEEKWASVWDHLDELRITFLHSFYAIGACFVLVIGFHQSIISFLTGDAPIESGIAFINRFTPDPFIPSSTPFLILGPMDGLALIFKVCFWLSIALTAPIWGWIWLKFILPGMRAQERMLLFPFIALSLFFSSGGLVLAYFVTLPLSNHYLSSLNSSIGLNAWTLENYINYSFVIYTGHAVAAELGLLLLFLVHFRVLSPEWLIKKRRIMIVSSVIVGAILTPPDVLTQLMLALPLILIYEIAILYSKWRNRKLTFI